jgi:hypothetical protein
MRKILAQIRELPKTFKFWFVILVFLNASPILIFQYYPTLDGPTHLYNANLLKEILINRNEHVQQFFALNHEIVPNWTSHFILVLFRLVFSPVLSNKIFLLIIAIGLPLSIFSFITRITPQNKLLTVFSLPFVYIYLFGLGFYNYCLSLVLLFITLNYWIHNKKHKPILKILVMFILVTISYFSHIYLFITLLVAVGFYTIYQLISQIILNEKKYQKYLIDLLLLLAISLPALILLYKFLIVKEVPSLNNRLPVAELVKYIVDVKPIIIHNYLAEVKFTRILFILVLVLFTYSAFKFFIELKHFQLKQSLLSIKTYLFLITLIFLFLFIFYSNPDSDGGYIPVRICTILYLFIFCWLSTLNYPGFIKIISFITILIINFSVLMIEHKSLAEEDRLGKKFIEASLFVKENSTILPVRHWDKMLDLHYAHLLGLNKPVVILENYEATTCHFPVVWNPAGVPEINFGDTIITDICLYTKFPENPVSETLVDYAIVWGDEDMNDCKRELMNIINDNYDLVYNSQDSIVKLYKLKPEYYN